MTCTVKTALLLGQIKDFSPCGSIWHHSKQPKSGASVPCVCYSMGDWFLENGGTGRRDARADGLICVA